MRKVRLEKLIRLVGGGTPSKKKPEYWNGEIPWASVKDFKSKVLTDTVDRITKEGLENSSSKLVEIPLKKILWSSLKLYSAPTFNPSVERFPK